MSHKNLTLRLPSELHKQLVSQSEQSSLSLNAHLINIVTRHVMETGYYPNMIKSLSGRLFEIKITNIPHSETPGSYSSRFDLYEYNPLYYHWQSYYVISVADELIYGLHHYDVVEKVGKSLLNFYNRQGYEIDQLAWQQEDTTTSDNNRVINSKTTRHIDDLITALNRNQWKDGLLILMGKSQSQRRYSG